MRADGGRFCRQREFPQMALIETALPPEALLGPAAWGALAPSAALTLQTPGCAPLQVPLSRVAGAAAAGAAVRQARALRPLSCFWRRRPRCAAALFSLASPSLAAPAQPSSRAHAPL